MRHCKFRILNFGKTSSKYSLRFHVEFTTLDVTLIRIYQKPRIENWEPRAFFLYVQCMFENLDEYSINAESTGLLVSLLATTKNCFVTMLSVYY